MTRPSTQLRGTLRRCVASSALLLLLAACAAEPKRDLVAEAEALCFDEKWDKAKDLLRQHLLDNPNDTAAHFYLGRCYLMASPERFRPATAEGEFQTALHIFRRNGRINPIEGFASADYFEYICQIESAKVYLNIVDLLLDSRVNIRQVQEFVRRGKSYVDLAAETLPGDPDLPEYQRAFESLELRRWN